MSKKWNKNDRQDVAVAFGENYFYFYFAERVIESICERPIDASG